MIENLNLQKATLNDYPTIQNMARFYVYELSRTCGRDSVDWALPHDGLYESFDFKIYFEDPTRHAFLIRVGEERAGFVLINQESLFPETRWNMGEFFILARFQKSGIGLNIAHQIWNRYPGLWEVAIIPENIPALTFWKKTIHRYTQNYTCENITVTYDAHQPVRAVFRFEKNN